MGALPVKPFALAFFDSCQQNRQTLIDFPQRLSQSQSISKINFTKSAQNPHSTLSLYPLYKYKSTGCDLMENNFKCVARFSFLFFDLFFRLFLVKISISKDASCASFEFMCFIIIHRKQPSFKLLLVLMTASSWGYLHESCAYCQNTSHLHTIDIFNSFSHSLSLSLCVCLSPSSVIPKMNIENIQKRKTKWIESAREREKGSAREKPPYKFSSKICSGYSTNQISHRDK